jgi:hypothetical protein
LRVFLFVVGCSGLRTLGLRRLGLARRLRRSHWHAAILARESLRRGWTAFEAIGVVFRAKLLVAWSCAIGNRIFRG